MFSSRLSRAAVLASALALMPAAAHAAPALERSVTTAAATYTPQLVSTATVARPRVEALDVGDGTTYIAGLFDRVKHGTTEVPGLGNMTAFDSSTGAVDLDFKPQFNGLVRAVEFEPATGDVFVAGDFSTVDGTPRSGLVKLDGDTGQRETGFTPYFSTGQVNDLELTQIRGVSRLVVAGGMSRKLVAVDPTTGKNTGDINVSITDGIPGARGIPAVFQVSVHPDHDKLIATGNFRQVAAAGSTHARRAFVMLDLPTATSGETRVNPWYYPGFAKECQATPLNDARRTANLQGVDWSPNGQFFNVAATGKLPLTGDVWHWGDTDAENAGSSVCDGVGRFEVSGPDSDDQAVWINYTGGDSVWTVQDTGNAVYTQGHFQWFDNPDGFKSRPAVCTQWTNPADPTSTCLAGWGDKDRTVEASRRLGVAALDPWHVYGKALPWAPQAPSKMGGKALLAVPGSGVWWGSDSLKWAGKPRYGLAFTPLS